ncbi:hypothetical protein [Dysgonomonas sp. PF1-16]|uniref:hypothetical protein n=2 Tax=Dysgonomonas TaxID=156973 RepID=UPI0024764545|nr:hypothetical protein [Dysgonomonas sp. PF1-16]
MDRYLDIVNSETEEILIRYKQKLYEIRKLPAQMTIEELKTEVMQGVEDAKNGLGTPHDELFKDIEGTVPNFYCFCSLE